MMSSMAPMPAPAQPTPACGPPASTQLMFLKSEGWMLARRACSPANTPPSAKCFTRRPVSARVESPLGSQPTCSTLRPRAARMADTLDATVLLPMPPLPKKTMLSMG